MANTLELAKINKVHTFSKFTVHWNYAWSEIPGKVHINPPPSALNTLYAQVVIQLSNIKDITENYITFLFLVYKFSNK